MNYIDCKLSHNEQEVLVETFDDNLLAVFPNHNRGDLRLWRRTLKLNNLIGEDYMKKNGIAKWSVESRKGKNEVTELKNANKALIDELIKKDAEFDALSVISKTAQEHKVSRITKSSLEVLPVISFNDWHVEEEVKPETVNGMNAFTLEIAEKRINTGLNNTLKLLRIQARDISFKTITIFLGGDFISGNIHEDLIESAQLPPIKAIMWAQDRILGGLHFLLNHTNYKLVIVCHPGNHSRITDKLHSSSEMGNSLEYMMYHQLKNLFKGEKRVEFVIAEGYHTFLDAFGYSLRFHHGHNIRYGGGVGGLFIPAYKAVSQWNKARRADYDVFAHFHTSRNGGNFICLPSLIGYSTYSIKIKADFEKPRQKFFMFTSTGEVIAECPIFLD